VIKHLEASVRVSAPTSLVTVEDLVVISGGMPSSSSGRTSYPQGYGGPGSRQSSSYQQNSSGQARTDNERIYGPSDGRVVDHVQRDVQQGRHGDPFMGSVSKDQFNREMGWGTR
jgi:hypothetical protein